MKKRYLLLVFCVLLLLFYTISYAAHKTEIGDNIHQSAAVYTDIVAYVNGHAIPSYSVNGDIGIVAEDLEKYGFDVRYHNEVRLLNIDYNREKEITADYVPQKNNKPVGSFDANIYESDISIWFEGDNPTHYNIGGRTIILLNSLQNYGTILWNPEQKEIYFDYAPEWEICLEDDDVSDTSKEILNFTIQANKNTAGEFDSFGENRQYISDVRICWERDKKLYMRFSIYQRVLSQTVELSRMLCDIVTIDRDGQIKHPNADISNQHVNITINGEKVNIKSVGEGQGNGHHDYYLYLDKDIRNMEDIESFKIEYQP